MRNEGADDDAYDEDISQLREEVERCRKILAELNEDATNLGQQMNEPQPLTAFVASLVDERFADIRDMLHIEIDKAATGAMPQISRRPELIHPLETLVDNAAQFAQKRVVLVLSWNEDEFSIQADDDGPGIQSAVVARLGEAYISSRRGQKAIWGCIFIANTMVRHVQGQLSITNIRGGGARAVLSYPRQGFDTTPVPEQA